MAQAFAAALSRLSAAGAAIVELPLRELARSAEANPRGALSSAEAWWWHRTWIEKGSAQYDPRVLARIQPGESITAAGYIEMLQQRRRFVSDVEAAVQGCDALLMPTTPDTAPTLAEVTVSDDSYFRANSRMLRNPSLVNLFDGCALTLPCHRPGAAPVGLMIAGAGLCAIGRCSRWAAPSKRRCVSARRGHQRAAARARDVELKSASITSPACTSFDTEYRRLVGPSRLRAPVAVASAQA